MLILPFLLCQLDWRRRSRWLAFAGVAGVVVLLVLFAGRTQTIMQRWSLLFAPPPVATSAAPYPESEWPTRMRADLFVPDADAKPGFSLGPRGESWRTALRSIAQRPLTGHGPANWMGAASQNSTDPFVRTFFQFLQFTHQDLLQFAVEWGCRLRSLGPRCSPAPSSP